MAEFEIEIGEVYEGKHGYKEQSVGDHARVVKDYLYSVQRFRVGVMVDEYVDADDIPALIAALERAREIAAQWAAEADTGSVQP